MGCNLMLPTFIGVGAARSGTTSLYHWLKAHPQVYMSPIKETNFFSDLQPTFVGPGDAAALSQPLERILDGSLLERHAAIVTSWEDYTALFANSRDYVARGEMSPSYLYYPGVAERIKKKLPKCRVIILLRDPVERAFSNYKFLVRGQREHLNFESALEMGKQRIENGWEHFWDLKGLGEYYLQVKHYLDLFPREQVLVRLYENMASAPSCLYQEVCRFIGVDESYVPPDFLGHKSSNPYLGPLRRFSGKYRGVIGPLKRLIPAPCKSLISSVDDKLAQPMAMQPHTREHLLDHYREDILKLQALLPELDVMQWVRKQEGKLESAK
jgi:hypothetical protein